MEIINAVSKPKVPNGYAYVLKTKQLENILADNQINIRTNLYYWFPKIIGTIFEVHYWLPSGDMPTRLYIRAGALLREDVLPAREKLETAVFPAFINWVTNISALPDNSPLLTKGLYFNAIFQAQNLKIVTS